MSRRRPAVAEVTVTDGEIAGVKAEEARERAAEGNGAIPAIAWEFQEL